MYIIILLISKTENRKWKGLFITTVVFSISIANELSGNHLVVWKFGSDAKQYFPLFHERLHCLLASRNLFQNHLTNFFNIWCLCQYMVLIKHLDKSPPFYEILQVFKHNLKLVLNFWYVTNIFLYFSNYKQGFEISFFHFFWKKR